MNAGFKIVYLDFTGHAVGSASYPTEDYVIYDIGNMEELEPGKLYAPVIAASGKAFDSFIKARPDDLDAERRYFCKLYMSGEYLFRDLRWWAFYAYGASFPTSNGPE